MFKKVISLINILLLFGNLLGCLVGKLQNVGCINDCHSTTEVKQSGF